MITILAGSFIVLHGLVHLWYITLSQRLVEFQPEMGWSGNSWLFTNWIGEASTRSMASLLYALAAIGFVAGGFGLWFQLDWHRPVLAGAAIFSSLIIFLFWDGSTHLIIQKGLLGFLINLVILAFLT